ncbi:hypothetical protein GDO81_013912 [Engystomops pustulosus]|uniref:Surfactant protein C n=1 Tax=Engystomops pustulosus TaxID=76066 RepID=A0AAV7B6Q6_ENGPU|nr:hypothetical protein GDO81_013912 [Engystomops pustulosus]
MEEKAPEQLKMKMPMSQVQLSRNRWILGTGLVVLMVGIIVTATLVGVYMTQKHTEKMVTLVYNAMDGQKVQQMITVNEQETMAVIFVKSSNGSVTVLYDYKKNVIGIRQMNSSACYVLRMDRSHTPSIRDILKQMDYIKSHNVTSDAEITYSLEPDQVANPIDVGMSVNILCNDVSIYWAKLMNTEELKRIKIKVKVKVKVKIKFGRK